MTDADRIERLEAIVRDLVGSLMYYDRKEDEDMPSGSVEDMIEKGLVSEMNIVDWFRDEMFK